jgi:hypothetical protein
MIRGMKFVRNKIRSLHIDTGHIRPGLNDLLETYLSLGLLFPPDLKRIYFVFGIEFFLANHNILCSEDLVEEHVVYSYLF